MIFPLRLKLASMTSLLLVLGIGTASWLLIEQSRSALAREAQKRAEFMAANLAQNARDPVLLQDDIVLARLVESIAAQSGVVAARLLDSDGAVVAAAGGEAGPVARLTREVPRASRTDGARLVVASRMLFRDVELGEAQVVLDLRSIVDAAVAAATRNLYLATGALLCLAILIAFATSGRITRPLRRLRMATIALAKGDASARVDVTTRDEVADLARAFNEMSESISEKRRIETAFRRYVSDHVLQQVLDAPEAVQLLGERREVTVLFTDIRQFTRLASWVDPERLVAFLNEMFELVTDRLLEHGATVDKYMGDAILAYFGAPIDTSDHRERAVAAAISIQRSVEERNKACESSGRVFDRLDLGIGIQTGSVVLGNIGSDLKMDYTAIGDAVNVANRLQKLAQAGEIVVTENVAGRLGDRVGLEHLGLRQLEGRDQPVDVYRVVY